MEINSFLEKQNYWFFQNLKLNNFMSNMNVYELRKKLLKIQSQKDAETLADLRFIRLELPNGMLARLPNKSQVTDVYNPDANLKLSFVYETDNCSEKNWSQKRCGEALKVINSWSVDFDWTYEQHLLGTKFGLKNCRTLKEDETLESLSIQSLSSNYN
jgi:hypothetical protein